MCKIKLLYLKGTQRHVFTIIYQGFIILAGSTTKLEFFYSENLSFLRVKNFHISSTACQNFYFLGHDRGMCLPSSTKVSQFQLALETNKNFFTCDFWKILCFVRVKNFLYQFHCMLKFLFLEGIQRHVFAIIHQGFIILVCIGAVLEFFY